MEKQQLNVKPLKKAAIIHAVAIVMSVPLDKESDNLMRLHSVHLHFPADHQPTLRVACLIRPLRVQQFITL